MTNAWNFLGLPFHAQTWRISRSHSILAESTNSEEVLRSYLWRSYWRFFFSRVRRQVLTTNVELGLSQRQVLTTSVQVRSAYVQNSKSEELSRNYLSYSYWQRRITTIKERYLYNSTSIFQSISATQALQCQLNVYPSSCCKTLRLPTRLRGQWVTSGIC